jgi:AraC-like DNA-binding protein
MEIAGVANIAEVFVSCKKEKHYSRELILPQPALVRVLSGEMRIAFADGSCHFYAGDTVLLPRNQLGRLSKLPLDGEPFRNISILFRRERLQNYYAAHKLNPVQGHNTGLMVLESHPLLESLFNSLLPYFTLSDELPAGIAAVKIEEAVSVLRALDTKVDHIIGQFEEPGKIDLVDFMEKNYMFNLSIEKFGYLTGRSVTTFKKDFKKAFRDTPGKWLTQRRLALAHYEIFEKKRRPSDVYFDVGFENLSHFSFAFKKQFGYNPTTIVTPP